MFPGLDLYCADPALPLTTAGEELDNLDHDLSVRAGNSLHCASDTAAIIPRLRMDAV